MVVSKELILELLQIIKEEYGREVSFREASEIANGTVGYFDLLAKMYRECSGSVDKIKNSLRS
jgi:hypothetical protein